jgi:hypothetical protein
MAQGKILSYKGMHGKTFVMFSIITWNNIFESVYIYFLNKVSFLKLEKQTKNCDVMCSGLEYNIAKKSANYYDAYLTALVRHIILILTNTAGTYPAQM